MRLFNLFPWRFVLRRIAHRQGFLDPLELVARLRRFSQPSEVQEPIELIRAGMVFHARGLVNTKVIQNNLDWVWPYWIVRQFSPEDSSFIPRAFSFSHVNLTHRNWTALGVPGCLELPIVDPRGMVTPHHDDWSVDHWFVADAGAHLFPSALVEARQHLFMESSHAVKTVCENDSARLILRSEVVAGESGPVLQTEAVVEAHQPGRFVISVRPCNPEGIQFIEEVAFHEGGRILSVDNANRLEFDPLPESTYTSDYRHGDVLSHIRARKPTASTRCEAGLATAAGDYRLEGGDRAVYRYRIPLIEDRKETIVTRSSPERIQPSDWKTYMAGWARLQVPDDRYVELFESSKRTLALLSQTDILPGPYTYLRFWFRDACIIANALLGLGGDNLVKRSLDAFPQRQRIDGYFHSQEGEWDSNGQVLWLANRYEELAGPAAQSLPLNVLLKAARWIDRKRRKTLKAEAPYRGLLPAGFSAEHLGPNDYYYWDDFWGAAGLRAAEAILRRRGEREKATEVADMAEGFEADILRSIASLNPDRVGQAIPAAPTRRMDSGAVGSMVADYPLQLPWIPRERLQATLDWLLKNSLHKGGFFQNMIHSGINAYLTLDLAQTCLRFGDARWRSLVQATAEAASPTGKWPEAVHPQTEGGCMGDGEHAWAAAEWCQMMRALFIDEDGDVLRIGAGLLPEWLQGDAPMSFGPTLTRWGRVRIDMEHGEEKWLIKLKADWHAKAPDLQVCLPGEFSSQLMLQ